MKWLSWHDDVWPDWAHASAVMLLAACCAAPWLWVGVPALFSSTLAPVMGPDFGTWLFGQRTLAGPAARWGGACLVVIGLAWLVFGLTWTRWADGRRGVRWLLAAVVALALLLYWRTLALA